MKLPSHYRRWTSEEDALLNQLLDEGLPYKVIGLRMDRERHGIEKRRTKLGLKSLRQRGGVAEERAKIVAWLRADLRDTFTAADCIEAGEHLK